MNCDLKEVVDINSSFWAKKKESNGSFYWLSLEQHSIDTMNTINFLWENWLSNNQKEIIMNSMNNPDEQTAKNLAGFLACVHDIGKATPAFQIRKGYNNSPDLDLYLIEMLENDGFSNLTGLKLANINESKHALAGQAILYNFGVSDDLASVIGGHHGKPVDQKSDYFYQLVTFPENYYQVEDNSRKEHIKWYEEQRKILDWSLYSNDFQNPNNLPSLSQPGLIILEGLLIMADWIASNENYFPLFSLDNPNEIDQEFRFEFAMDKWHKTFIWESRNTSNTVKMYDKRFGFEPRKIQVALSEVIDSTEHPGLIILEAPMGGGKTEGALISVEQLAEKKKTSGMFFGLPTQATSNGMFSRVKNWLNSIAESDFESKSIQLLHGKAYLNKEFHNLRKRSDNVDRIQSEDSSIVVNEWFSGRKNAILDDFVVGTVDQFLLLSLKQKHLALRHLGFTKKVVVIDEVHAYDAYMGQFLYQALRWLGVYNVPVIIMSATLPSRVRADLVENYLLGVGANKSEIKNGLDKILIEDSYPMITYTDSKKIYIRPEISESIPKQVEVISIDYDELISIIKNLTCDGGIVGIIVNTVRRAQEITRKIEEVFNPDDVELLHSSFIATDRVQKEQFLLNAIGKGANRAYFKIIIGTQVIEQSLDIDFDVLITDLAPMDLLLQRIGRLHRHEVSCRPNKLSKPKLYIMGANNNYDFEEGTKAVYSEYILLRTLHYLPNKIVIPNDISNLVQKVYSDLDIKISDDLTYRYFQLKEEHEIFIKTKESKAKNFRLDRPFKPNKDNLIGWLKNNNPNESEEGGYAQVRDGANTIEVIALKTNDKGYSIFGENTNLADDLDNNAVSTRIASQTIRLPNVLCKPYCVEKTIYELEVFNYKELNEWRDISWLKGALGLIFDQNNQFVLNGYILTYDSKYGLMYEKVKEE